MFRLTLLLFAGMLAALFTLGQDRGQLRPGLAKAEAEGRLDEVWAEARAKAAAEPLVPAAAPVSEAVAAVVPAPQPAKPQVTLASTGSVVEVEAGRTAVQAVVDPVFSLAALGNEPVPGEDGTPIDAAVTEVAAQTGTDQVTPPIPAPPAGGTIWYVSADSVNVRAAPSTQAEILGKLGAGEATLMIAAVDAEWARIVIQGDGIEGYVALRYLRPEAP